ncbi:MAG TPA: ABC transporter substrate-binding protein [Streptosporangiaceae bacterium]|nr:ABC transporter substrate-binding protein [Streptosporangiaceae bacterium]
MNSVRAGLHRWSAATKHGRLGRAGLILGLAALAPLGAGCHAAPAGPGQVAAQQITVAAVPGFANAPLQVAVRDGLFARHHVDVTVQTYPTLQRAYAALGSGQAEVASGDYAGLLYTQADGSGARLRLLADGYDATPGVMEVLTLPGSAITAPQDLEGQTVATPLPELAPFATDAPYNAETLATEAVLQSDGVSPSSVVWKAMPPGSMITALRDHQVSAIVAPQPYILQAETQLGAVELFDVCSGVTASLPLSGYFTTAGFARDYPAALAAFQAALTQAKASTAQLGTVRSVLSTLPGMSAQQADLVTVGQYPTFLSVGQVQRVADLMYGTGMITTTLSVRGMLLR